MLVEEWQRVEDLFHAALDLPHLDRAAYLSRECAENESLRVEVESLVRAFEISESFIAQPALTLGMKVLDGLSGSLTGQAIGHYKLIRLLGEGGMGAVYLAEDTVLERQVALKFIASPLMDDEWAREHLLLEARAVAKLENVNISAVYGHEKVDGHQFIVMQYVEGETLAAMLRRSPIDTKRALEWADQLAGVLSAAHARGIIHRDIKPQNIMVTPEGQLKVLDFGLAKFTRRMVEGDIAEVDKTSGVLAGTITYMSPEQRRGEELDGRSDIFSFGIVLSEMIGWGNPFQSGNILETNDQQTFAAIKSAQRSKNGLSSKMRAGLERIVLACLKTEKDSRCQSAEQLRKEISELRQSLAAPARRKTLGPLHYATAATIVLLLIVAGRFLYQGLWRTHSLGVLTIENLSKDPRDAFLSEGLTRNLADKFGYIPRLQVVSLGTGKNTTLDPLQAARQMRSEAVLKGQIVREGEQLHLRLQMVDTSTGKVTWDHNFPLTDSQLVMVQDEITREVTSQLGLWLIGNDRKLLEKHLTNSQEALQSYNRGRYLWSLDRTRENIQAAISLFDSAIKADPSFAKAYAGLADCYALTTGTLYGPNSTREAMDKARWAATNALQIDSSLVEAHTSMGLVYFNELNWPEAEREFKTAIQIQPAYAPARYWYSNLLATQKRFDEAIQQGELAKSFDPYSRLADMNYGRALYYEHRFDEAAAHFTRLRQQSPDYRQFRHLMAFVQVQQGQLDEAISGFETLHSNDPLYAAAGLGYAYGKAGKRDQAEAILKELDELAKTKVVPPFEKSLIYIGLGDYDKAFAQLEECYNERYVGLAFLTIDPIFDPLRQDRRFFDLAARLKLPT